VPTWEAAAPGSLANRVVAVPCAATGVLGCLVRSNQLPIRLTKKATPNIVLRFLTTRDVILLSFFDRTMPVRVPNMFAANGPAMLQQHPQMRLASPVPVRV